MDKTINASKIDKYTIRSNVFNHSFKYLTFFKLRDDFFFLLLNVCFDKRFVGNNNVFEFMVDFNHFEFHVFTNVLIVVTNRFNIDLRTRKERFDTKYVYNHTTFSTTLNKTLYDFFFVVCIVNTIPSLNRSCLSVRKN